MAKENKLAGIAIKYGPLAYAAARKYGPALMEQLRKEGVPGKELISERVSHSAHRRNAIAHAHSVVDGSMMPVFHHSEPYFVVFSGETPIATHPRTNIPYEVLLTHADLTKRVRPDAPGARGLGLGRRRGSHP